MSVVSLSCAESTIGCSDICLVMVARVRTGIQNLPDCLLSGGRGDHLSVIRVSYNSNVESDEGRMSGQTSFSLTLPSSAKAPDCVDTCGSVGCRVDSGGGIGCGLERCLVKSGGGGAPTWMAYSLGRPGWRERDHRTLARRNVTIDGLDPLVLWSKCIRGAAGSIACFKSFQTDVLYFEVGQLVDTDCILCTRFQSYFSSPSLKFSKFVHGLFLICISGAIACLDVSELGRLSQA